MRLNALFLYLLLFTLHFRAEYGVRHIIKVVCFSSLNTEWFAASCALSENFGFLVCKSKKMILFEQIFFGTRGGLSYTVDIFISTPSIMKRTEQA